MGKGWLVVCRFGNGLPVAEQVRQAIGAYRSRLDLLPAAVVVNPKVKAEADAAVQQLGLGLPVAINGGTLVGEVWLRVSDPERG